jgi:hypothetical protein
MSMAAPTLKWSSQLRVSSLSPTALQLPGDKIILPPSALEQLLAAAPLVDTESSSSWPLTSSFDPFNPYTFAAERHARDTLRDQQPQLPHPLTFRLVNPSNGRVTHAGIKEFSAQEGEMVLSKFLKSVLGVKQDVALQMTNGEGNSTMHEVDPSHNDEVTNESVITVHAKQLAKGTYVKLRPLEAGYDAEDWKALLEQYLRTNFTTLTNGEVLNIPKNGFGGPEFKMLVDGFVPEGDGVCIVDTDLEVDIEALNEEQARETLREISGRAQKTGASVVDSSRGGKLDLFSSQDGQVLSGEYVDYDIPSWDRLQGLEIELSGEDDDGELDLLASPFAARQRARPRLDEHVFSDFGARYPKRIRISPTNMDLQDAESIWIAVRGSANDHHNEKGSSSRPHRYQIRARTYTAASDETAEVHVTVHESLTTDDVRCPNCHQLVPKSSFVLHENFCLRNNILCPKGCGQVFQKRSEKWHNHWHCEHDPEYGNSVVSHEKHDQIFHVPQICTACGRNVVSTRQLAQHRTTSCPSKLILCQFCHLVVPQEGDPDEPNPEAILSGLTVHELADGARTTECHLCNKIVRLRDMSAHLKHHELQKLSRPLPRICRNPNCGRTLDGADSTGDTRASTRKGLGPGNDIGLCNVCFGPLYVATHDPDGKALKRRIERRFLTQLLNGCGKTWCANYFCKTGKKNAGEELVLTMKDALPLVKPYLAALDDWSTRLPFCVDENSQTRRKMGELLAAETSLAHGKAGYALEWCIAALEASMGDLDRARNWLSNWAPSLL